jgi:hypothetical protein
MWQAFRDDMGIEGSLLSVERSSLYIKRKNRNQQIPRAKPAI